MENPEVTIVLKANEWNVVLNAMAQRPYAEVENLIKSIKSQGEPQIKPKEEAK